MNKLTDSQRALILLATETNGRIENYPKNLGGGARAAVMRGLLLNGLIVAAGAGHILTDAGYEAVGHQPPEVANADKAGLNEGADSDLSSDDNDADDLEATANTNAEAEVDSNLGPDEGSAGSADNTEASTLHLPAKRTQRKLDEVVALLLRPEGATIAQVVTATEWQQHSVRGFFAGTLKKKGYVLTSEKDGKADRVYRIKAEAAVTAEEPRDEEE